MFKAQFRERKEKTTKFCNINDNGCLDWLFYQNVFPLRESNSILSGKDKGVLIQIHQTLKTS